MQQDNRYTRSKRKRNPSGKAEKKETQHFQCAASICLLSPQNQIANIMKQNNKNKTIREAQEKERLLNTWALSVTHLFSPSFF